MTELLLDAKDVVVEYPVKGFRKQPFKTLQQAASPEDPMVVLREE